MDPGLSTNTICTSQNFPLYDCRSYRSIYSGTSDKGPSEIGTASLQGTLLLPLANRFVYYLTSEIGTASLQRTQLLFPKCPLFGGSTVYIPYTCIHNATSGYTLIWRIAIQSCYRRGIDINPSLTLLLIQCRLLM